MKAMNDEPDSMPSYVINYHLDDFIYLTDKSEVCHEDDFFIFLSEILDDIVENIGMYFLNRKIRIYNKIAAKKKQEADKAYQQDQMQRVIRNYLVPLQRERSMETYATEFRTYEKHSVVSDRIFGKFTMASNPEWQRNMRKKYYDSEE